MIRTFRQFLNEDEDHLHLSIMAAGKYLTSSKKIEEFLSSNVVIEHKTDGVHLTALKINSNGNMDDWIISYKGNIMYGGEFDFALDSQIKKQSFGSSQFKFVLDHFNKIAQKAKEIPNNTELFIEFLMSKPTLSSNYTQKHGLVLIGHSISRYTEKNGKLITSPNGFDVSKRNEYAKILDLDVPSILFNGILGSRNFFEKGIINKELKSLFPLEAPSMNWDSSELLIDDIRRLFLTLQSKYGGKEEGIVIKYKNIILKFQQEYQLDQEARRQIKLKFQHENPDDESNYWKHIRRLSLEIASNLIIDNDSKLVDLVKEISDEIKILKIDINHPKKTIVNIKDDIQLTSKQIIMRKLKGNNNALVLGKFRVLTKAHYSMINDGLKKFDGIVVALITSKDTKETQKLRRTMLEKAFGNRIEIIESTSGNLFTLINKTSENINWIIAGTDRVASYRGQLDKTPDVRVFEVPREDDDISASKVIENIEDFDYFESNTPREIHSMYEEILKTYRG